MTDDRLLRGYSGHTHDRSRHATDVLDLDGEPVVVSVDDGTVWICPMLGDECSSRQLDLESAEPDHQWYVDNGFRDETDDPEDEDRRRLRIHPYDICSIATTVDLDGRPLLVTGGQRFDFSFVDDHDHSGGIVRAWDLGTGKLVGPIMTGHDLGVTSLTTIPNGRTRLAVSTCEVGTTLAWDLDGNRKLAEIDGSYNGAMGAAFVDGRPIAVTGGHDDFVQVWDLSTGRQIGEPLTGLEEAVWSIAVTELDGRGVVLATDNEAAIHVWDLATRERSVPPLRGHTGRIFSLRTTVVGGRGFAVSSDETNETRVWDLQRGTQSGDAIPGRQLVTVTDIAGSPVAVTVSLRNEVQVWDLTRF